jgi:hypothetical protein
VTVNSFVWRYLSYSAALVMDCFLIVYFNNYCISQMEICSQMNVVYFNSTKLSKLWRQLNFVLPQWCELGAIPPGLSCAEPGQVTVACSA